MRDVSCRKRFRGVVGIAALLALSAPTPAAYAQTSSRKPAAVVTADPTLEFTDFTEYTYSVGAGGIGSFADLPVTRTFDHPIVSLTLSIVAGRADDIGYVGSRLVTDIAPMCADVGTVTSVQDVTDQVTISGNTASFVLRAQENCCCVTGWGTATQSDRADARFQWDVKLSGADKIATITATDPIIPRNSGLVNRCVQYRSDLTGVVTKAGDPQPGIALRFASDRGAPDTITQPTAVTDGAGSASGRITTRKQGVAHISDDNSDIDTPNPAAITFQEADYEAPFLMTAYIIANEADYSGPLITNPCGLTGTWHRNFLYGSGVLLQGSGKDLSGQIISIDFANSGHPVNASNVCFHTDTCAHTASGACAEEGVTIAVDRRVIPMGALVNIERVGDRTAQDTGQGIVGEHIDVFRGFGRAAMQGWGNFRGTVRYLSGGGTCN